jgi:hypothetical protein
MYLETNNFLEKDTAYSVIVSRISSFLGKDVIDMLRGNFALEVGGGGGAPSGIAANILGRVICTDIVDRQLQCEG